MLIYLEKSGDIMKIISELKSLLNKKYEFKRALSNYDGILDIKDLFDNKEYMNDIINKLLEISKDNVNANELLADIYLNLYKYYDKKGKTDLSSKSFNYTRQYLKAAFYMSVRKKDKNIVFKRIESKKNELNKIVLSTTKDVKEKVKLIKSIPKQNPSDLQAILEKANYYISHKYIKETKKQLNLIPYDKNNYELQCTYLKIELLEGKFDSAEERVLDLLDIAKTPNSEIWVAKQYSRLCIRNKDFDSALYTLKKYYNKYPHNSDIINELITYYIVTCDYEEAFRLLKLHESDFVDAKESLKDSFKVNKFYLNKKLNIIDKIPTTYIEKQIDNYSKEYCLNYNDNSDLREPINYIYEIIKDKLPSLIPNKRGLTDTYIVDTGITCGIMNNEKSSMFHVEVLTNTEDIIKMSLTSRECNESKRKENKVKRMS